MALEHMDDSFGGMGLDVLVRWPTSVVWSDPMVLETLEKVHLTLNDYKEISHPLSLATFSGTLSQSSLQRLQPEQLGDFVDPQRTAIVRSRVTDCGSMRMDIMFGEIEKSLTTLAPVGWTIDLAGMTVVSARNIRQLILDLSSSLTIEVFVIGIILAVAFRSPLIGIISLLPNMFPLAALAAVLVATGRTLEPANIIVFNVCLGLSVDDTVHLLSSMNHHRRPGISTGTAVRRAALRYWFGRSAWRIGTHSRICNRTGKSSAITFRIWSFSRHGGDGSNRIGTHVVAGNTRVGGSSA